MQVPEEVQTDNQKLEIILHYCDKKGGMRSSYITVTKKEAQTFYHNHHSKTVARKMS